jgi:DNA modification methylase
MLHWVGKRAPEYVKSFPAQLVEVVNPHGKRKEFENPSFDKLEQDWHNLLFHGDNKEVLGYLISHGFRGKIDLVYIDPPFDSGADYIRKITLRGMKSAKMPGDEYTLDEQIQYTDIWANDNYLQFLYERLLLLRELLSDKGNIFVQMDHHRVHYVKCIMDEIFGEENFVNEIIWHKGREGGSSRSHSKNAAIPTEYQNILLYAKNKGVRHWEPPLGPYKKSTLQAIERDTKGWFYTRGRMGRTPAQWELEQGKGLKTYVCDDPSLSKEEVIKLITASGAKYVAIGDVWSGDIVRMTRETDYPTEKPESLLSLIIQAGSDVGHLVLDCFVGSGTTCLVAQKFGRRWIGVDINKGAIQTTSKRIKKTMNDGLKGKGVQTAIDESEMVPFAIYKVNDYDLQIFHREAIQLAVDHIGIERIKTDLFFEGILGGNLAKIIDFSHPLTLLDLQLLQDELKKRPEENRNITIVCLGKETTVDPWVADYNKKHTVNKLEIIELRTDTKYGKLFLRKPAQAKASIARISEDTATIKIEDFISPTIIERLDSTESLLKTKIPDFRSMIDVVLIDPDYDGKAFNVGFSDVPEKKNDLIEASYKIKISKKRTTVAVKVIDMLGEEVIVTKEV